MPRPVRALAALIGVIAFALLSMVVPIGGVGPTAAHAATGSAKTVAHPMTDGLGLTYPRSSVTMDQTTDIHQRQVIHVSWSGVEASRGYWDPPPAETDTTAFPVVIIECWGVDSKETPMDPRHCEGAPWFQHKLSDFSGADLYSSMTGPGHPNPTDLGPYRDSLRFEAVNHTVYDMEDAKSIPTGLQGASSALPYNALSTYSLGNPKGNGHDGHRENVEFEVRGGSDLSELGCSATQACTIEVIPIVLPWCDKNTASVTGKYYCNNRYKPTAPIGSSLDGSDGYTTLYSYSSMWWMNTNWQNRFSFPITMAPEPGECAGSDQDQRPKAELEGSEPAKTVLGAWGQSFCLDRRRSFKLSHTVVPEEKARTDLTSNDIGGYGANAIFTTRPVGNSPRPLVHAPVAVTGWTVAYKIDDNNKQPYTDLTLSPLLLAKLLTESYSGAPNREPTLSGNPAGLFLDPEFKALNPNFKIPIALTLQQNGKEIQVMWDTQTSDSFGSMFAYIDADAEARAWLNGKPDSYSGMVVNPAYRGLPAPQMYFQLLDNWKYVDTTPVPPGGYTSCHRVNPIPWYSEINQTSSSLEDSATLALARKNPHQICFDDSTNHVWKKWLNSSPVGQRYSIAFTTIPFAEQYGLNVAKLQSHLPGSKPVIPSGWENPTNDRNRYDSLGAALGYTKQDKATGVVSPDWSIFPFSGAYAGVMPVYATIPTAGLDKVVATQYADFLEFAAEDGQTPGYGAGQLPPGYSPLPEAYANYTRQAAKAVRDQNGAVPPPPPDLGGAVRQEFGLPGPGTDGFGDFGNGDQGADNSSADAAGLGSGNPALATANGAGRAGERSAGANGARNGANPPGGGRPTAVAATRGTGSWVATWGLPLLLGFGVLAGVAVPVVRVTAQPGHPVRVFLARIAEAFGGVYRRLAGAVGIR